MNWAYIAGFFDGEGSIRVPMGQKYITSPQISIYQSDLGVLLRIQRFLDTHGIHSHVRQENRVRKTPHRVISKKQQFILDFSKKSSVILFLRSIRLHVIVKKTLVEDILRFMVIYPKITKKIKRALRRESQGAFNGW